MNTPLRVDMIYNIYKTYYRSSPKSVAKIYSKFTGEHVCRSVISIKLQSNFIDIAHWHGCSPVDLLQIFRAPFYNNISGQFLLIPAIFQTTFGLYIATIILGVLSEVSFVKIHKVEITLARQFCKKAPINFYRLLK